MISIIALPDGSQVSQANNQEREADLTYLGAKTTQKISTCFSSEKPAFITMYQREVQVQPTKIDSKKECMKTLLLQVVFGEVEKNIPYPRKLK